MNINANSFARVVTTKGAHVNTRPSKGAQSLFTGCLSLSQFENNYLVLDLSHLIPIHCIWVATSKFNETVVHNKDVKNDLLDKRSVVFICSINKLNMNFFHIFPLFLLDVCI